MDGVRSDADLPPMSADLSPMAIDLAREDAFRLGAVEVHPALGEVVWDGGRETLQPKVMQVLVALAARRGEVVSRDALIELCWGGRAVGDDAVHRCVAHIRRLAQRTGAFHVETFPRIGYRLTTDPIPRRFTPSRRALAVVAGLLLAVVAGTAILWNRWEPTAPATPRVEVTALRVLGGGASAEALADGLSTDIAGFLNESGVTTTRSPLSGGPGRASLRRGDLTLGGAIQQEGQLLRVRVFLEDPRADLVLWSSRFERPVAHADELRDEVAVAATEAIYTALEPLQQKGLKLDPQTLAIHIRGSDIVRSPQLLREGEPRRAFEQVVARAPTFAGGHGTLAVTLVNEARRSSGAARDALLRRAKAEADAAIRIDPATAGGGFDALYLIQRLTDPRDIVAAENQLLEGLRQAPEFPFLNMRECRLLTEVGRTVEAMGFCQRALALRPLAGPIGYSYARAIYVAGELELAQQAAERAARRNPDHANTRQARFEIAAFSGSPALARALLRDPRKTPQFISPAALPALEAYLTARETGRAADREVAIRELRAAGLTGRIEPTLAIRGLAVLGATDTAFELMDHGRFDFAVDSGYAGFLLEPSMAAVRKDRRFWPVAARAGLVDYWLARGRWPEFCGGEILLARCRSEAAQAMRSLGRLASQAAPEPSPGMPEGRNPFVAPELRGRSR